MKFLRQVLLKLTSFGSPLAEIWCNLLLRAQGQRCRMNTAFTIRVHIGSLGSCDLPILHPSFTDACPEFWMNSTIFTPLKRPCAKRICVGYFASSHVHGPGGTLQGTSLTSDHASV
ncbi:hypothetical protein EDC04DRAFT_2831396 [Pisolithus marmoratus]|nr:hypothetical protein EDC04DRAFT_2831396 [Pisolithus marmoratus]